MKESLITSCVNSDHILIILLLTDSCPFSLELVRLSNAIQNKFLQKKNIPTGTSIVKWILEEQIV
jgi:hypothetical protein